MVNIKFKDLDQSNFNGAKLALQSELGFPTSGDLQLDEDYAAAVVVSVLNEFGYKNLPKEADDFLVDIQNGKYKNYFKNIIESQDK